VLQLVIGYSAGVLTMLAGFFALSWWLDGGEEAADDLECRGDRRNPGN
jgi:hypothetical protein